jgi:uncharacterized protein (TIGR02266 family)
MAEPNDKELRGPVNLRIKFRSASLQQFIERYGVDVSRGGIFIRTREPLPVGTRLKLDFQLVDAAPLFQGDGTVVWIREYDPGKTGVTPGMGVRFDRLTPESQPTLDKILDEKMKLQQSGAAPGAISKAGAGLAVRRPSGVIAALDTLGPKSPPPPPAAAVEVKMDAAVGATPAAAMPASQARSGPVANSGGGIFSRPRTTSGLSTLRAASGAGAMFEPPTAADIDKALLALEEKGPSPSLPAAPPPAPPPMASSSAGVGEDEPTKVFDVAAQEFAAQEAITGQGSTLRASGVPVAAEADDLTAKSSVEPAAPVEVAETLSSKDVLGGVQATSLDAPLAAHLDGAAQVAASPPPAPPVPAGERDFTAPGSAIPKIVVDGQGRSIESGRFRSDAKYKRASRRGRIVVSLLLAGAAAAGVVFGKKEWDRRKAATVATEAAQPAQPAPTTPPPAPPAPTPEATGAGTAPGATAAAPQGATAPAPAPTPPPAPTPEVKAGTGTDKKAEAAAAAPKPEKPEKAEKSRRRRSGASAEAPAVAASDSAGSTPDKAADQPEKGDKPAPPAAEKAPAAEAAGAGETAKTAEAAPAEKPVLKITSSPAGAEVVIDGSTVGTTPYSSKDVDPTAAHAITVRKDGFEAHERMISGSDWTKSRSGGQTLKMNIKLKRTGAPEGAPSKDESGGKASDVEILTPSEP